MKLELEIPSNEFYGYQGQPFVSYENDIDWSEIHYEVSLGMAKTFDMMFGRCPGHHPEHTNVLQPIDKVYQSLDDEDLSKIDTMTYQETVKYLYFKKNAYIPFYQCLYIVGDGVYGTLDYANRTFKYPKLFPKTHQMLRQLPMLEIHRAVICVTYLNNPVPIHRVPATGLRQFVIRPIKKVKSYTFNESTNEKYYHPDESVVIMNPKDYYGVDRSPSIEWYILAEGI